MNRLLLVLGAAAGVVLCTKSAALAAPCATLTTDNEDNIIIVGETYNRVFVAGSYAYLPRNTLGSCVITGSSVTFDDYPTCNNTTSYADRFRINSLGGDDVVSAHPGGLFTCTGGSIYIGAYSGTSGFSFGIEAQLGDGADEFYGSGLNDLVWTDSSGTSSDDGAIDIMCGYGGDDILTGDAVDSSTDYECIDGGAGTNYCGGRTNSTPDHDEWANCYGCSSSEDTCLAKPFTSRCSGVCPATPPSFI